MRSRDAAPPGLAPALAGTPEQTQRGASVRASAPRPGMWDVGLGWRRGSGSGPPPDTPHTPPTTGSHPMLPMPVVCRGRSVSCSPHPVPSGPSAPGLGARLDPGGLSGGGGWVGGSAPATPVPSPTSQSFPQRTGVRGPQKSQWIRRRAVTEESGIPPKPRLKTPALTYRARAWQPEAPQTRAARAGAGARASPSAARAASPGDARPL